MENYQIKGILIATAKRPKSQDNTDNEPILCGIHKECRKRAFTSQEGRYDKYGKLPMNMVMSKIARRDKNSQSIEGNCINESATTSEGSINSYRFPNEKIKPWKNKKKILFTAPTVVDVIQSKYNQLYRNTHSGLVSSIKSAENIKHEDPLEASVFPKFVDGKKSELRVKWEDESPIGFMKPSKTDNIRGEHFVHTSSFIDGTNPKKQNEIPPIEYPEFRFFELYKEKHLIHECNPPEKITIKDSCLLGALKTEKEATATVYTDNDMFLDKNKYSSENCFLQSVTDSLKCDTSSPRQRWNESRVDNSHVDELKFLENESNLQLTCNLFDSKDDSKFPLTCDLFDSKDDSKSPLICNLFDSKDDSEFPLTCDLFEVPNLEEETIRMNEQNDSECSIYESPLPGKDVTLPLLSPLDGEDFFCFQKDTSQNVEDRNISPISFTETIYTSPKAIYPKVYITDPDDLLKTPK